MCYKVKILFYIEELAKKAHIPHDFVHDTGKLGCAIYFVHFYQQNAYCWATSLMCVGRRKNFHYLLMAE